MNFIVKEYQPSSLLEPYVECYWEGAFNLDAAHHSMFQMVPNACLELIIHLDDLRCQFPDYEGWTKTPDYMLIGLITQAQQVRFDKTVPVFTIRFKPEALYYLFKINGSEIIERYVDADHLPDEKVGNFCKIIRESGNVSQMIDQTEKFLLKVISRRSFEKDYVGKAADLMRNSQTTSIQDISERVCISQRQLERKFREVIGVGPKQYLRMMRINKVIRLLEKQYPLNLTSVAYHCGYFDQAHFIKDFKRITGFNPALYFRDKKRFIALPGQVVLEDD